MSLRVLAPGLLTSVQDLGRHGAAAIGVGAAGAMDSVALRLANLLVGNAENAAALELTLRGPRLRFDIDTLIAITGAPIEAHSAGAAIPAWRPVWLRGGSEVVFGGMRHGARSYLAFAGGLRVDAVLGSRSTDLNAALGPFGGRALAAGDELSCVDPAHAALATQATSAARDANTAFAAANWSLDPTPWFDVNPERPIHLIPGAHFDALDAPSQRALFAAEFRIGTDSNRVGCRLEGARLALHGTAEIISAGVMPGTLQLPPGGTPIALLAEAPTSGGYPRIAQVAAIDLPRLAQRRPGDRVRFTPISLIDAQNRYLERERALAALSQSIHERLHA